MIYITKYVILYCRSENKHLSVEITVKNMLSRSEEEKILKISSGNGLFKTVWDGTDLGRKYPRETVPFRLFGTGGFSHDGSLFVEVQVHFSAFIGLALVVCSVYRKINNN
jgi:hypothetical protein